MECKETPYANSLFEQPWWLDIVAPGNWDEVVVKENDEVIARLPFVLDNKKIIMPEWTQTLGIWMKDDIRNPKRGNLQNHEQKEIIFNLIKQLPKHKSCNICLDSSNSYILPFRWLNYNFDPSFSYRINFKGIPKIDNIKQNYSKHVVRDIKAAKKKIHIVESSNINEIITLREKTFKRQGRKNKSDPKIIFQTIERALELNKGRLIYGIDEQGLTYNGSFCAYDKKSNYYLMAYNDPSYQNSNSLSLLTNDCIEFAYNNSDYFDFEGSNVEGIENNFRAFGGELITNYKITKQHLFSECKDVIKPRLKNILGYRI
jgi:hypothetical protein